MFAACVERQPISQQTSKNMIISQNYQGTSVKARIAFNGIFFLLVYIALVFLLLAEYYLKRMFKEPTIRNSYQFLNVPSHKWHSWKVSVSSILFIYKYIMIQTIYIHKNFHLKGIQK